MAEIISRFTGTQGRPAKYPWEEWADGRARRLLRGRDFDAQLKSFRTMVHRKARDLGCYAHTDINEADQSIEIYFYDPDTT